MLNEIPFTEHSGGDAGLPAGHMPSDSPLNPTHGFSVEGLFGKDVTGNPEAHKDIIHHPGDNTYNFEKTGNLVSCEMLLRQAGIQMTEADLVHFALEHGYCTFGIDPQECGRVETGCIPDVLKEFGMPSHLEFNRTVDDLESYLKDGHGVIVEINTNWKDFLCLDRLGSCRDVVVTGIERDSAGTITGVYISDSTVPPNGQSGVFMDLKSFQEAWNGPFGYNSCTCVVTDPS